MADWTMKAHDLLPSIQATLSYRASGVPVDLTTAVNVTFVMKAVGATTATIDAPGVIVDPPNGVVRYDWVAADVATPGNYQAEFEVLWPQSKPQTFPTDGYLTVLIEADLSGV